MNPTDLGKVSRIRIRNVPTRKEDIGQGIREWTE